jgi:hypothetical protein
MTPLPRPPSGNGAFANAFKQLIQCVAELRPVQVPGARVSLTTRGAIQQPKATDANVTTTTASAPVWQ